MDLKPKTCKCGKKALKNRRICWNCYCKKERIKRKEKFIKLKEKRRVKKENSIWSFKKADTKFSEYIRKRDGKCLRCGRVENLQCSHFWSRRHYSVRYDFDNAITLCYACHYGNSKGWEYDQSGGYRDFMIAKLGIKRYNEMEIKHRQSKTKRNAISEIMEFFKNQNRPD